MRPLLRLIVLLCLALPILFAAIRPAQAEMGYFGRPEVSGPAKQATTPVAPAAQELTLPQPFRAILGAAIRMQVALNAQLRSQLDAASRADGRVTAAFVIILASFLYGVLHAVGPGHGKVVVASYLATRRARFLVALRMAGIVAATQALSAIVLVGVLAAALGTSGKTILNEAGMLEFASYVCIAAMGLWMAFSALRPGPRTCGCGLPHGHDHNQSHGHGPHDHEDHHDHGHPDHGPAPRRGERLGIAVLAGLRPCSGAILVLLFSLANGIFAVGAAATLAMGVGTALTVAAVSVGAVGANRVAAMAGAPGATAWLGRAAALTGALIITTFGAAAATAIATGMIAPLAG